MCVLTKLDRLGIHRLNYLGQLELVAKLRELLYEIIAETIMHEVPAE